MKSSHDVVHFIEDLGFDPSELADLAPRSFFVTEVRKFIEKKGLTGTRAADCFWNRAAKDQLHHEGDG